MKEKIKQVLVLAAGYWHFFILGCFVAIRGFLLPQIKDYFDIDYTTSGLMLVIGALPGFVVSLFSGYIFGPINRKLLLLLSSGWLSVALVFISFSTSYALFLIFSLFMGLSTFLLGTGVNISITNVIESIKPEFKDNGMILLHLVYSLGGSLVLLVAGTLLKQNFGWRTAYFLLGIAFAATPLLLIFSKYPPERRSPNGPPGVGFNTLFSLVRNKKLIFYSVCIFFCGGLEFCLMSWVPTFLEKGLHLGTAYSLLTLCVFFCLYCLGRFLGVLIIHKLDKVKTIIVALCLSALCLAASFIFRIRLLNVDLFFSLTGLLFSIIFPTVQNLLIADFKNNLGTATSIFLLANAAGCALLPFFIGVMNDVVTPEYGILFVFAFFLFIIPSLLLAVGRKGPDSSFASA